MNFNMIIKKHVTVLLLSVILVSCNKEYLEVKPDQKLLVPSTLSDLQALLDNVTIMNFGPGLHIIATDDFHVPLASTLSSLQAIQRNSYLWASDIYEGTSCTDWNLPYQQIFYSNVALDGLNKIEINNSNREEWDRMKGAALFYRAMAYFQLVNQFSKAYSSSAAGSPGVPIKLSSDVNERPGRGTVSGVFDQIVSDLTTAVGLLPIRQEAALLTRPSKLAVFSLLARLYLIMGQYEKARDYADACIKEKPDLMDYNVLSTTSTRPISFSRAAGSEVIYWHWMVSYGFGTSVSVSISPEIVASYDNNDLRKSIFLRDRGNGIYTFKGNYTGDSYFFTGMAIDEMYLIRAECLARLNDVPNAMADLNLLMEKRWDNEVAFPVFTADTPEEALDKILEERQKELITRGCRWTDLRRLNQDPRFAIAIKRIVEGVEYNLSPNDKRYVFPIPLNEISASAIEQNER